MESVLRKARRNERETPNHFGVLHGESKRNTTAQGIAQHVDLLMAEFLHDPRHVVTHVGQVDLPIAERGAAVAMKVDRDHPSAVRQGRQHGPEHVDRAKAAVQQQQRLAGAVDLVVVVESVDSEVAALRRRRLGCGLRYIRLSLGDARRGSGQRCSTQGNGQHLHHPVSS